MAINETGADPAAPLLLFNSTLLKIPFPSIVWATVPIKAILPVPVWTPELNALPDRLIIFPLSLSVPKTSLKLLATFIEVPDVPAKFTAIPAGLSIVKLFNA